MFWYRGGSESIQPVEQNGQADSLNDHAESNCCELHARIPRNLHLLHKRFRRHSHFASPLAFFNATTDLPFSSTTTPSLSSDITF
jgi:hypothetical protein